MNVVDPFEGLDELCLYAHVPFCEVRCAFCEYTVVSGPDLDDTDTYMMVCEGGFEVKGQDHMAKWTGLDTSAPLPVGLV